MSNSLQPNGLYSPWTSPGQNTGLGSLSLLQGIFPAQGSNPGLPHWRQVFYQLSHKVSPRILEWVAYPFSSGSTQPRNWTRVSCISGGFFTNWAIREAPREGGSILDFLGIIKGPVKVGDHKLRRFPIQSDFPPQFTQQPKCKLEKIVSWVHSGFSLWRTLLDPYKVRHWRFWESNCFEVNAILAGSWRKWNRGIPERWRESRDICKLEALEGLSNVILGISELR